MQQDQNISRQWGKSGAPRVLWLEPHCDECYSGCYDYGPTWCEDDVYEPCEKCGKLSTKYEITKEPVKPYRCPSSDEWEDGNYDVGY